MPELEGLEFQIKAHSEAATEHLNSLSDAFSRLKGETSNMRGLSSASDKLQKISDVAARIRIEPLERLATAMSAFRSVGDIRISPAIPRRITELGEAARSLSDADLDRLERLGQALGNFGSVAGTIRIPRVQVPTRATEAMENTPVAPTADLSAVNEQLEDTRVRAMSLRSVLSTIGQGIGAGFRGFLDGLRLLATSSDRTAVAVRSLVKYTALLPITLGSNLAVKVKQSTASLAHLFSAIKRIALYRLIRSAIREITQGFQEGIKHIYAYSRALNGEFAAAMDNLATSSLYLKNSLGAVAAPIIQALVPAINFAIDRIVTLMNMINMLVSALGGKATFTAAKRMETSFADAAAGAAGAAKQAADKIKSYTIGIDELNILDDSSGAGGGGGGGGAGGLDTSSMFEELPIDNAISDFAQRVREAFESKDWQSLGTLFGEKFNELVGGVHWNELGTSIGDKLNGLIVTAYYFLKTADARLLGQGLATFINNGLSEIDFKKFGGTMVLLLTKAIDFLIGFVLELDPVVVGNAVSDFFIGVFDEGTQWLNSYDWDDVSRQLTEKISGIIMNIRWGDVLKSLTIFGAKFQLSFQQAVFGALTPDEGSSADSLLNILAPLRGLSSPGLWKKVTEDFKTGLGKAESSVRTWWQSRVSEPLASFTTNLKNDASQWWENAQRWWNDKVGPVREFTTSVRNTSDQWWRDVKNWWNEKVTQPVSSFVTNVRNDSALWWANVKSWWDGGKGLLDVGVRIINNAAQWWQSVKDWWNKAVGTLTAKLELKLPRVIVTWQKDALFNRIDIPKFEVRWNANGAILDGARIFGAVGNTLLGGGEAGREALLPLDRNTEWMDTVAERVRETMKSADTSSGSVSRILAKLDEIEARLAGIEDDTRRQADKPSNTYVSIGGKDVHDAVVTQGRADGYSFT